MTPVRLRVALAASGWVVLACTALPAASPLRVAVALAFLAVCPGLAVVVLVRPRLAGHRPPMDALEAGVLTVALSLALDVLVAEGLYLTHRFTVARAVGVLAVITTAAALLSLRRPRRRPAPDPAGPADGGPAPRAGPARGAGRAERAGRTAAAGLLAFTAACGLGQSAETAARTERSTPAAAPSDTPVAPGPWRPVFQDEFDGTSLDRAKWTTCYDWNDRGCTNSGNHELEWYLPGQVSVGDGHLSLTAQRRPTAGSDGRTYPWTSGMVSTGRDSWNARPRETFLHGYFAAALQVPDDDALFPAFWLLPVTRTTPPELDVAEFIANARAVQMTVHWTGPGGADLQQNDKYGPDDFPDRYHVFALDWEPTSLTWYVDGVQRYRVTDPAKIPDVPMEVLLNLAVGYPTAPPDSLTSAQLKVDWVRVWQH